MNIKICDEGKEINIDIFTVNDSNCMGDKCEFYNVCFKKVDA